MPITIHSAFLRGGVLHILALSVETEATESEVMQLLKGFPDVLFRVFRSKFQFFSLTVSFSFYLPRVNTCPNNCSGHGECHVGNSTSSVYCECENYWKGEACDIPYCLADCGEPERGSCKDKTCVCTAGWQGRAGSLAGTL